MKARGLLCASLLALLALAGGGTLAGEQGPGFGRELTLGGLSDPACEDIYEIATQHAVLQLGYRRSEQPPPRGDLQMTRRAYLRQKVDEQSSRDLLVGLECFATQQSRIYLWGRSVAADGSASANPDLDGLVTVVQEAVKARQQSPRSFAVRNLLYETYQLSNIDPASALEILKGLGFNTGPPGKQVDVNQLPAVFEMPYKSPEEVVGRSSLQHPWQVNLPELTLSVVENRLMIVYHPSQSEEVGNLKELLEEGVDVPAQQVLIEGMLIELTEDDLKELGAEWEAFGVDEEKATFLEGDGERPFIFTFDPEFFSPEELANRVRTTIRALIQEGRGEILSSPSVLVLDNRNAKIQVVQDVPIFESLVRETTTNFKVRFERVGIILNIKPRINREQSMVAMQIMVEVSEAPQEDFVIIQEQSVAPLISRRTVETVARVRDNTPFIIGGLIRNESAMNVDRVPILSHIPLVGRLFQRRTDRRGKREVIIVLTPRIIKTRGSNRPVLPKDSARFDFLNNRLFRNSYRLKADDVFDLGFLESNRTVLETMDRARQFVYRNPGYANREPFSDIMDGNIPGEDAVVVRMIYEIAKDKLNLPDLIPTDQIIIFQKTPQAREFELRGLDEAAQTAVFHAALAAARKMGYGAAEESGPAMGDHDEHALLMRKGSEGRLLELSIGLKARAGRPSRLRIAGRAFGDGTSTDNPDLAVLTGSLREAASQGGGRPKEIEVSPAGFSVEFLARGGGGILEKASPDGTVDGYFEPELDDDAPERYPRDVLFVRYGLDPKGGLDSALQSPTARLEWRTVHSRDEVEEHLLEINSLSEDFRYHEFALALDTVDDLERLKTAIAMREIAKVNNIEELLQLRNFRVGRKIVIPELEGPDERIFLADRVVAEFFFKSDYYYYALRQRLELAYDAIAEALAKEREL